MHYSSVPVFSPSTGPNSQYILNRTYWRLTKCREEQMNTDLFLERTDLATLHTWDDTTDQVKLEILYMFTMKWSMISKKKCNRMISPEVRSQKNKNLKLQWVKTGKGFEKVSRKAKAEKHIQWRGKSTVLFCH